MAKRHRLIIHAPNVHRGGGKSLLQAVLAVIPFDGLDSVEAIIDKRMDVPKEMGRDVLTSRISPTVIGRARAEWLLQSHSRAGDLVLCVGNLPPLLKNPANVVVFLQSRYLLDDIGLLALGVRAGLRTWIERLWLRLRAGNADSFVVQTPSMARLVQRALCRPAKVLPFVSGGAKSSRAAVDQPKDIFETDFLYVASGEPHKNHRNLIEAWRLLAAEGIRPSLYLTVEERTFPGLFSWIEEMSRSYNLRIKNIGAASSEGIGELYRMSRALIYPSTLESFGLPLIEARGAGLPILASELDYVRDIVDPGESFDPHSPVSVARAVKRFLGIQEQRLDITDAKAFLQNIMAMTE